jgi:exopolyphosphatase/guanosine-5'-triphosphate,3'-diphosphate pyrophosphatase
VRELDIALVQPIEAGLRMGVMWDLYLRSMQRDRREQSVRALAANSTSTKARAAAWRTARRAVRPAQAGRRPATRLLHWSALLHEMGMAVSQTGYHKHAAYMIENADLPGFTAREQKIDGRLIVAQKGNLRKVAEALADARFRQGGAGAALAILLMHARIEADFSCKLA